MNEDTEPDCGIELSLSAEGRIVVIKEGTSQIWLTREQAMWLRYNIDTYLMQMPAPAL